MSRGRPKDPKLQEKTRTALMDAARILLTEKSYSAISIRELAALAETQSGMISYYFGNKKGLIEALLKRAAEQRQKEIISIATEVMDKKEEAFDILVDRLIDLLLKDPWIFKLFQDEATVHDSEIGPIILREFSNVSSGGLERIFTQFQHEGLIHRDINIRYFVATFISLIGFPIMTQPLLRESTGIDLATVASAEWKRHISNFVKQRVQ